MSSVAARFGRAAAFVAAAAFAAAAGIVGTSTILWVWDGPSDAAPGVIERLPPGYGTALYVPNEADSETGQAWTQLAAATALVESSQESLAQAEALRATAVRLVQATRENAHAREERPDADALDAARYQELVAEAQLARAEDLLAKAREMSESALVILEITRQNAFRPQGAARRSRHS